MPIEVTARDTDTGETKTRTLGLDDHIVICSGRAYVDHVQWHGNGTQVVTVKLRDDRPQPAVLVHFRKGYRAACGRGDERTSDPAAVTCQRCKGTGAYRDATESITEEARE